MEGKFFMILLVFLLAVSFANAGELKPKEYTVYGSSITTMAYKLGGRFYSSHEDLPKPQEGDIQGLYYVSGKLRFWNVGEKGNSLFGKKDYSKAELVVTVNPSEKWTRYLEDSEGKGFVKIEKFDFSGDSHVFSLTFSGYSNGVFKNEEGEVIGHVECGKDEECKAVFDKKFLDWFFGEGFTARTGSQTIMGMKLEIPIPASAFEIHCPFECEEDYHKIPIRVVIDGIEGEVEVIKCGAEEDDWSPAREGMILQSGDCVRTDEDSRVRLVFGDMSNVIIGEETEVSFKYGYQKSVLQLIAGRIWENTKHALKGGEGLATVDMPEVAAGIKGTSFIAEAGDYEDRVVVFNGSVEVKSKRNGRVETLGGGKMAVVSYDGNYSVKGFDTDEETKRFYGEGGFSFLWVLIVLVLAGGIFILRRKEVLRVF